MEVLLRQDVENLGKMGDVVEVADGYARNYLLPRNLVVKAAEANVQEVEAAQEARRERDIQEKERIDVLAEELEGFLCYIEERATEEGHLFGSVTASDIANSLAESGFEQIRPSNIALDRPLEELGDYEVEVLLHPEVSVHMTVRIAAPEEEEDGEED
jgi:large subunit ribosomal protein L9